MTDANTSDDTVTFRATLVAAGALLAAACSSDDGNNQSAGGSAGYVIAGGAGVAGNGGGGGVASGGRGGSGGGTSGGGGIGGTPPITTGGTAGGGGGAPLSGTGWLQMGYDIRSTFHNSAETVLSRANAGQLAPIWEVSVGGNATGTPIIVGDTVFAVGGGGVFALDARTGGTYWSAPGSLGTSGLAFDNGRVYVHNGFAVVQCLDAMTGAELWNLKPDSHPNVSGWSTAVVAGDYVLVGGSSAEEVVARSNATFQGFVIAINKNTGVEAWRQYTESVPGANGATVWSSPSADLASGTVYASTGNNYTETAGSGSDAVFAFDINTGAVRWKNQVTTGDIFTVLNPRSPDADFGANPIVAEIDGQKFIGIGQKSGEFFLFDSAGNISWRRMLGSGNALTGGVLNNGAFDGEKFYAANNIPPTLFALDARTGNIAWQVPLPATCWAPITLANGVGIVPTGNQIRVFDTDNGSTLFEFTAPATVGSGVAIANGRIFFGAGVNWTGTTPGDAFYAFAVPGAP